ncbi:MAG TPA: Minf_1886 family protein [Tepidisphaeraceae bacterium]|nr:Minf_1886 family protein [Tepidisphaeraceae bacterium]
MPPKGSQPAKPIEQVVEEIGLYPIEAYDFVQRGLQYTVQKIHNHVTDPKVSRHVSGRELSEGLREFALMQWGMLARSVLRRWNLLRTEDFGRIVFALVEGGYMTTTEEDSMEDFRGVFDFSSLEEDYHIDCKDRL